MALAINTSKRKFHKLLDNLTNSSTTNLTTTHAANTFTTSLAGTSEPPTKRSHLSITSTTSPNSSIERPTTAHPRPSTSTSSCPSSVRIVGTSNNAQPPASPPRTPNYTPHSRPAFLARLQTFSDVRLWTPKPEKLSEIHWAARGWRCEGPNSDTVACKGGCEARVVVKLLPRHRTEDEAEVDGSQDMEIGVEEELVERYKEMIVTGHGEGCLWRRAGCREGIYRIPVDRALWAEGVRERYASFKGMEKELPEVECCKVPLVEGASLDQLCSGAEEKYLRSKKLSTLDNEGTKEPEAATEQAASSPPEPIALALSLFGWSLETTHSISVLRCHDCFQRIGLWLYRAEKLRNDAARLDLSLEDLKLNLLTAHREYCPWKSAESQANPPDSRWAGKAFWEMLQEDVVVRARVEVEDRRVRQSLEGVDGEGEEKVVPTRKEIEEQDKAMKRRLDKVKRAWSTITRKKSVATQRPQSG
ncbi:hypothetical protein H2201_008568 [Coniosporium apollinis]|uniref:C3HC-type domain-containing protein n=1 Tax=Coniosporium apollinis TaxID=61459 RepID=A0ABQ9NIB8_9PEZI|nr:hypothetical protein H2201_008568 [Coniosporium apollinis]